jgi:hypothetical protein
MRISLIFPLLIAITYLSNAQTAPFQIKIDPLHINELGGLQTFAYGQSEGKWLIIGGRLDGLHRRQPWATFDEAGQNNQLTVVDPDLRKKWSAPLASLPVSIQEQLSSTNMEFHQEGDFLYILGGYGYSKTEDDHITYPYLTAVNVPEIIKAIINDTSFTEYFRQIKDEQFAVTGGYLNKIYNTYYLTGGQRFTGRYNPMNNPTFTQEYTNSIRKFTIQDNGTAINIAHLSSHTDTANLHRRDFNVIPQMMPDGQEGLTAFSGVFQIDADLPFLNCVNIDSSGYSANKDFLQYYNHYHCAQIPLFSARNNEMHSLFFGGIAQYSDNAGILVQDNNVPFVKTIARVTRDKNGKMAEYKLPVEMPALLGAGSEFIRIENLPQYNNEVIKLDEIMADTTLIGYIYGGINSSAPNIFWSNDGSQSSASNEIYKVFLLKNIQVGMDRLNYQSTGKLQLQVFPSLNDGKFMLKFNLETLVETKLIISDTNGKVLEKSVLKNLKTGKNSLSRKIKHLSNGGVYFVTIETASERATRKIIVEL